MANLERIRGIGSVHAGTLASAGVKTTGKLRATMPEVNSSKRLERHPPSLNAVQDRANLATNLPRVVEY